VSTDKEQPVADPAQGVKPSRNKRTGGGSKKERSLKGSVIEIVLIVAAAFVIATLVQAFLVKAIEVDQRSMDPTLSDGDRILIDRISYRFHDPNKGDVVVFRNPAGEGKDLVKRVVAVAGDTVSVHDGVLWLNGVAQDEPFIKEHPILAGFDEVTIEPGYVWVMGDNRNDSQDSRAFGPIDIESILGCGFCVIWPFGHWRGL
jgi:signal peptidase I